MHPGVVEVEVVLVEVVLVDVEVVLLVVLVVVARGLRHLPSLHCNRPQQRPLPPPQRCPRSLHSLSSSSSAPAKRAGTTVARALATKSFSALRRLIEPSARARASSSKERSIESWLTRFPHSPKAGHWGISPVPLIDEGTYEGLQRPTQGPNSALRGFFLSALK